MSHSPCILFQQRPTAGMQVSSFGRQPVMQSAPIFSTNHGGLGSGYGGYGGQLGQLGGNFGIYSPLNYGQNGLFNIAPELIREFPFGNLVSPGLDTPQDQQNDDMSSSDDDMSSSDDDDHDNDEDGDQDDDWQTVLPFYHTISKGSHNFVLISKFFSIKIQPDGLKQFHEWLKQFHDGLKQFHEWLK